MPSPTHTCFGLSPRQHATIHMAFTCSLSLSPPPTSYNRPALWQPCYNLVQMFLCPLFSLLYLVSSVCTWSHCSGAAVPVPNSPLKKRKIWIACYYLFTVNKDMRTQSKNANVGFQSLWAKGLVEGWVSDKFEARSWDGDMIWERLGIQKGMANYSRHGMCKWNSKTWSRKALKEGYVCWNKAYY